MSKHISKIKKKENRQNVLPRRITKISLRMLLHPQKHTLYLDISIPRKKKK